MIFIKHRVNELSKVDERYGIECDVWNYNGQLVLSHDAPNENSLNFNEMLKLNLPFYAINVKSTDMIALNGIDITNPNYFIFDCPVPEAIRLAKLGLNVFTRISEYEPHPSFLNLAKGVWIDQFIGEWVEKTDIYHWLNKGLKVAIVSPELHGREYKLFWQKLKGMDLNDDVYLCTKYPEEAESFFKG
jgi:hypothetical protein